MPGRPWERAITTALVIAVGAGLTSVPVLRAAPAATDEGPAPQVVAAPGPAPMPAPVDVELGMTDVAPVPTPPPTEVAAPAPEPEPEPAPVWPQALPLPLADDVQVRVDQALDSLGYPWQELGYDIRFVPYTGGLLGLADPATRTITVFVKPTSSVQALRVVLAHEIGHALDNRTGSAEQRARYRELRGIPADLPWYPCDRCDDFDSPAGDFAEVFAAWLVGATDFRSRVAPLPTPEELRRLVPLFAPPSSRTTQPQPPQPQPAPSPRPSRKPELIDLSPGA